MTSQLRSAEAAAAEGESAAAENASLREQLRELKRDRGQLEHHRMVRSWGCGLLFVVLLLWVLAAGRDRTLTLTSPYPPLPAMPYT